MCQSQELISSGIALLLKEKGFDFSTQDWYDANGVLTHSEWNNHNKIEGRIAAPTFFEACDWLRQKGIHVCIDINLQNSAYLAKVYQQDENTFEMQKIAEVTIWGYINALEWIIEYVLMNLYIKQYR